MTTKATASRYDDQDLAHAGTLEAIQKLQTMIKKEQDPDEKGQMECALEECQEIYYSPRTEKEEKEFLLLKIIEKKEEELVDAEIELEHISFQMEVFDLETEITQKIIQKTKNKTEQTSLELELQGSSAVLNWKEAQKKEIEEKIIFLEKWIQEAKKSIKTKKYQTIPWEVLSSISFDFED